MRQVLGIIGGMGPEATAELYLRIIRKLQEKGAYLDSDFPQVYISSIPMPDMVASEKNTEEIQRLLTLELEKVKALGCNRIMIACNTACSYLDADFISPVKLAIREASAFRKPLLLATRRTISTKLFDSVQGLVLPDVDEQKIITAAIIDILHGKKGNAILIPVTKRYEKAGCDSVILGCTELSLILDQGDTTMCVIDTLDLMADNYIRECVLGDKL